MYSTDSLKISLECNKIFYLFKKWGDLKMKFNYMFSKLTTENQSSEVSFTFSDIPLSVWGPLKKMSQKPHFYHL